MKWLLLTAALLLTLLLAVWGLLFTAPGNAALAPMIEKELAVRLQLPVQLSHFKLRTDRFELLIALTQKNQVRAEGNFSLTEKRLSARYSATLGDLAALEPLTGQPMRGRLSADGTVKGPFEALKLEGVSDIAGSQTRYHADIIASTPVRMDVTVRDARIADLLYMSMQPPFAYGKLNIEANAADLDSGELSGQGTVRITDGRFDSRVMHDEFNVTLPKTTYAFSADAVTRSGKTDYTLRFDANLADIRSSGRLEQEPFAADLRYNVRIDELALFAPVTPVPLKGSFSTQGTVKGNRELLKIEGRSDVAGSDTRYRLNLKSLSPDAAHVVVKHLKLKRLLYMLEQPLYADADVGLQADLTRLTPGKRQGTVTLEMARGVTDRAVVAKAFDWPYYKGTSFTLKSQTELKDDRAEGRLDFASDLLTLEASPIRFAFDTGTLEADYVAEAADLNRFYFLTNHPLRGKAKVTGDLRYDGALLLHADSKIMGGEILAEMKEQKLHCDLKNIDTLKALHMLTYPEVFSAAMNGTFDYVPQTKRGTLNARLSDGRFTKNVAFDLLKNYTTLNLYEERFNGDTEARILAGKIDADLQLHSNRSSLSSKHALIDPAKNRINAKVHLDANNNPVDFRLNGRIDKPNVTVDAGKLIEREVGKQINRLLDGLFK